METYSEDEPLPIPIHRPELELAWRGLVYSIGSGYITRDKAFKIMRDWDEGRESEEFPKIEDTDS